MLRAAAIQAVYSQVNHQGCWVRKTRNVVVKVYNRNYGRVNADAQAIYPADDRSRAELS